MEGIESKSTPENNTNGTDRSPLLEKAQYTLENAASGVTLKNLDGGGDEVIGDLNQGADQFLAPLSNRYVLMGTEGDESRFDGEELASNNNELDKDQEADQECTMICLTKKK
nr:hypothetical protein Iba_chr11aCG14580 [Ipomoea batatas]